MTDQFHYISPEPQKFGFPPSITVSTPQPRTIFVIIKTSHTSYNKPYLNLIHAKFDPTKTPAPEDGSKKVFSEVTGYELIDHIPLLDSKDLLYFGVEMSGNRDQFEVVGWTNMRNEAEVAAEAARDEEAVKAKADGEKVEDWWTDDGEMRGVSSFNLKVVGQKYSWWNIIEIKIS